MFARACVRAYLHVSVYECMNVCMYRCIYAWSVYICLCTILNCGFVCVLFVVCMFYTFHYTTTTEQ